MSTRRYFQTSLANVLLNKLQGELLSAGLFVDGVANDLINARIGVDFVTDPVANDLIIAQSVIDSHDPIDYELQLAQTDYTTFLNMVGAGLTQIANDITANDGDISALAAASTLAAVKPIVANMLTRFDHILNRQNKIIRAIRHVTK